MFLLRQTSSTHLAAAAARENLIDQSATASRSCKLLQAAASCCKPLLVAASCCLPLVAAAIAANFTQRCTRARVATRQVVTVGAADGSCWGCERWTRKTGEEEGGSHVARSRECVLSRRKCCCVKSTHGRSGRCIFALEHKTVNASIR